MATATAAATGTTGTETGSSREPGREGEGPAPSGLFASERPPRLVLRFVILLSVAVALTSAAIVIVVHRFAISEAERSATRHAGLVASTLLQREVEPGDLAAPVSKERRAELDAAFRGFLESDDFLSVALVGRNGRVTYSSDHRRIGALVPVDAVVEASGGTIVSFTSRADGPAPGSRPRTLETYAPVGPRTAGGAAVIV